MANILVFIELEQADTAPDGGDGEERIVRARASEASLHALWVGRRVASQLGATLYAMLPCVAPPCYGEDDIIAVLSRHGADKVVLTTSPSLAPPALYATHAEATFAACDRFPPQLVLFPQPAGRELGPRVAFKLRARYGELIRAARSETEITVLDPELKAADDAVSQQQQ